MPSSKEYPISKRSGNEPSSDLVTTISPGVEIPRLARLIADGDADWPDDVSPQDTKALEQAIRQIRRTQLIKTIAKAIADAIARSPKKDTEDVNDHL